MNMNVIMYSGKMSALNEVNKVIHSVHYTPGRYNTHNSENEVKLFHLLIDWLIGWLIYWLIGWLVGWFIDWLISLPADLMMLLVQDWLTADRMAAWIKENNLIKIVLRDSLHQPQYVEKLEKIIRQVILQAEIKSSIKYTLYIICYIHTACWNKV